MNPMNAKDTNIFKEMVSNPQKVYYSRKGSTSSEDIVHLILNNPSAEKVKIIKEQCPNIESIKINKITVPTIFEHLSHIETITKVDVSILEHIKKEAVEALIALDFSGLRELRIEIEGGTLVEDEIIGLCQKMVKLEKLDFNYNRITSKAMVSIVQNLKNLRTLCVPGGDIRDQQIKSICQIKHLKQLDLTECFLTVQGIKYLSTSNLSLETLHLSESLVGNRSMLYLAHYLPKLKKLYVDGCGLSDIGAVNLGGMKNLKELRVDSNKISDYAGYKLLYNLRKLQSVNISNNYLLSKKFMRNMKLKNKRENFIYDY